MLNQPEPLASEGIRKVYWGLKVIKVIAKNNEQAVLCLRQSDLIALLLRLMRDNLVGKKLSKSNALIFKRLCSTFSSLMHHPEAKSKVLTIGAKKVLKIFIALSNENWTTLDSSDRAKISMKCIKTLRLLTDDTVNAERLN